MCQTTSTVMLSRGRPDQIIGPPQLFYSSIPLLAVNHAVSWSLNEYRHLKGSPFVQEKVTVCQRVKCVPPWIRALVMGFFTFSFIPQYDLTSQPKVNWSLQLSTSVTWPSPCRSKQFNESPIKSTAHAVYPMSVHPWPCQWDANILDFRW